MKTWFSSLVILVVLTTMSFATVTTQWGAQSSGSYLYDSTGTALAGATYRIELVIDSGRNTVMNDMISGGLVGLNGDTGWGSAIHGTAVDDVIWSADSTSWQNFSGVYAFFDVTSDIDTTYAGDSFYFRWFNSNSQATATEAGIIYGAGGAGGISGWTIGTEAPDFVASSYGAAAYADVSSLGSEYTAGPNDGWQTIAPVPEPGTMALFALGVATLAAARRRKVAKA